MRDPRAAVNVSVTRSQLSRASSSAATSDGYLPESMASTSSNAARVSW